MKTMHDIDFLPLEYHRQHAQRQVKPWRVVVVLCAAMLLAAAAFTQYRQHRQAQQELDSATALCDDATRENGAWVKFQEQMQAARSEAELFTYLRFPWPRSQLLSAVVAPLPREITIYQIQIATEASIEPSVVDARPRADAKADEERLRKAPATQRDAQRLRNEFDKERTYIRIAGTTTDAAAVYDYLNQASKGSLFSKVELKSVESVESPQGPVMHFQALLLVRPGYGQPGGPNGGPVSIPSKVNVASSSQVPASRSTAAVNASVATTREISP